MRDGKNGGRRGVHDLDHRCDGQAAEGGLGDDPLSVSREAATVEGQGDAVPVGPCGDQLEAGNSEGSASFPDGVRQEVLRASVHSLAGDEAVLSEEGKLGDLQVELRVNARGVRREVERLIESKLEAFKRSRQLANTFDSADALWREAIRRILELGAHSAPRGMGVTELTTPTVLTLGDVHRPFIASPLRRANYRFGLAEACWILSGSDNAQVIGMFNKQMLKFSDDGERLWGAYGPRLMGQLNHVISTLRRDHDTRQAVVTTWRPMVPPFQGHVHPHRGGVDVGILQASGVVNEAWNPSSAEWDGASWRSKDVPCTVAWHFQRRNDRLNLTVFMRSNDVWLGLPYDVLSFTTVQRVVASILDIEPGVYHHVVSNLHLYDTNRDAAISVLSETPEQPVTIESFDGWFNGVDVSQVMREFGTVMSGDYGGPIAHESMIPFIDAVRGDTSRDGTFKDVMRVNGRGGRTSQTG